MKFIRAKWVVALLFGALFVMYLWAGWFFSSILFYPGPLHCRVKSFVYCKGPSELGLSYKEVSFRSKDNFLLKGWWIPAAKDQHKAVIFVHGRGADRREGIRFVKILHDAGIHTLAFDLRNCGKSQKSFNSMNYHERKDVVAAIDFVTKKQGVKHLGLFGFSMGAATSMLVMAKDTRVKAGLFEGGFSRFSDVIAERAKSVYGVPRYPLLPLVEFFYSWRGQLEPSKMDPLDVIATISPRPVFFIQGTKDRIVVPHHGKRLYAKAKQPKTLWLASGVGHIKVWQKYPKKATKDITAYFTKYLR